MNECVFSPCRNYRYSLYHVCDPITPEPGRLAMWIGLNPSKGNERELDPTLKIVRNRSLMHGCDRFVMTNLFAYVSTDPTGMLQRLDPIGPDNDAALQSWAAKAAVVICCWGSDGRHLQRDAAVATMLARYDLRCLALTIKGAPRHPLRLRRTNQLPVWRMP